MATTKAGPVDADRLKSFVERIERFEEERKAIGGDIKDIYAEAKGVGYDVKTIRWVVQERRMDAADRAERDTLRDVYKHALDTAVGLVRGGLSLREAGRITGASKSSIHRALAVPAVSHDADGVVTETQEKADGESGRNDCGTESSSGDGKEVEGAATVSVGAVGPSSARVAPSYESETEKYLAKFSDDDMPEQPPFLRGRAA